MAIRPYDAREAHRKSLLKQMGISQQDLGVILGRSQSFVSQLLSGKIRSPRHEAIVARVVQRSREELFDDIDRTPESRQSA